MSGRRILITGHAGFIGYWVASYLLVRGWVVLGIDDLNPYYPIPVKKCREEMLKAYPDFHCLNFDLSNPQEVSESVRTFKPEVICNLAAQAGVRYSLKNPSSYVRSNISGFVNILEAAKDNKVSRVIYASSSSVYGGNHNLPFSEEDAVEAPLNLYAASKRSNELIASSYTHLFGLNLTGLRFFTVYGPCGRPDMAMWIFSDKILGEEPLPVFNNGNMSRDFTYVSDVVRGVVRAIEGKYQGHEVINLGNNRPESLMKLVGILGHELGKEPRLELMPMQPGDVPATWADISKAKSLLDWEPLVDLEAGVRQWVQWYLSNPELREVVRKWRQTNP